MGSDLTDRDAAPAAAEGADAVAVLREIEWAGQDVEGHDFSTTPCCPSCGWTPPQHAPDCRLAAALSIRPAPAAAPREGDEEGRMALERLELAVGRAHRDGQGNIGIHWFDLIPVLSLARDGLNANAHHGPICGVISPSGPNGTPLACAFAPGHDGAHSWASLPTYAADRIATSREGYDTPGVGHEGDLWSIPEMAGLAEEVHAAWRDGMFNQGREVASERRQWETLDPLDHGLDRYIAQRLLLFVRSVGLDGYAVRAAAREAARGEG